MGIFECSYFKPGQRMVTIMLSPKAGQIQVTSPVVSSMPSPAQSAVRPVPTRQAIRGPRSRPSLVAPSKIADGL